MTLEQAKLQCRKAGMTLSKKDGEYRVNFRDGKESSAYYTNDILDAVRAAMAMRLIVVLQ